MASKKDALITELSKFVEQAQWAKAVVALQSLTQLEPTNAQYHLRLGDYSLKAGNKPAAINAYYQAADLFVKAGFALKGIASYKMILRIAPDETQAMALMKAINSGAGIAATSDLGVQPPMSGPSPAPLATPEVTKQKGIDLLFASLTKDEFGAIVDKLEPLEFVDGERVIAEGEEGDAMFLISRGGGKVVKQVEGQEVVLGELAEGEFFGEMSLLVSCPRSASVFARGETAVLRLKADDLFELMKRYPRFAGVLDEFYERRSKVMRKKVREIQLQKGR